MVTARRERCCQCRCDRPDDSDRCRAHAAEFEKQFFEDLDALGCRVPSAIPRITDHIPEIVSFIEKIMKNGFAYAAGDEGNKSVYFDTAAFRAAGFRCDASSFLGRSANHVVSLLVL